MASASASFGWAVLSPKNEMIVRYHLRKADAQLISAAPQLVEALRAVVAYWEGDVDYTIDDYIAKARAALSAACGEP
jgi:hypothetical protein